MTKVIIAEDCGNSPKNTFVQELTVAFAKGDLKSIIKRISDDFTWTLAGIEPITGQENVVEMVRKSKKVALLQIDHIATHGKTGAVDGTLHLASGKTLAFCDVYVFGNAKGESVKSITSYRIELSKSLQKPWKLFAHNDTSSNPCPGSPDSGNLHYPGTTEMPWSNSGILHCWLGRVIRIR